MIYVVSGMHRSGTSAMMTALIRGGIKPFYSDEREREQKEVEKRIGRINNPTGFWEVGQDEYMRMGFTSKVPDGQCVKIQAIGLPILAPAKGYKIIYMRRDPDEIRESYKASFPDDDFDKMHPNWPTYYWNLMDGVRGIMQARRDVELLEVWYDDLLADTRGVMQRIRAIGVPINVSKATEAIQPEARRYGG